MRARRLAAVALTFAAAIAVFAATRGDERAAAGPPTTGAAALDARRAASTDEQLRTLQQSVRAGSAREAELAAAYLQKARETGDPSFYARADGVLEQALEQGPDDPAELVEASGLAAGRHDFRGALRLARRATALAPDDSGGAAVLVDALVELGRYRAAERVLQRAVDRKPNLAAYTRVAYLRELHGDLPGAAAALRLAIAAGGSTRENGATVRVLLGDVELARGRLGAADRAYRAALAEVPRLPAAAAGRARLAAREGRLAQAIAGLRRIVRRLPLPEHVIALGEAELAAGRRAAARRTLALVAVQQRLLDGAGVNADTELAVFQADHGDPEEALRLARRSWRSAPSVRSADALGWALTRSGDPRGGLRWTRRALRLGSLDPTLRFHAGAAALTAGRRAEGRRQLRIALAHGLDAHPWQAARARRALEERS
jgi:tetratricopeptide (TPR) repeat protein